MYISFVAHVFESFHTVVRCVLDCVLSRLGLPALFRHVYFEYHTHVRLRSKLTCSLGKLWIRDGVFSSKMPLSMIFIVAAGQFVGTSAEIVNPSLVGYSTVSSLLYITSMLTRSLDAKHTGDELLIHSFTCAVHQTAFSLVYKLVHLHPTHDADHDRTRHKDKKARRTLCSQAHMSHSRTW